MNKECEYCDGGIATRFSLEEYVCEICYIRFTERMNRLKRKDGIPVKKVDYRVKDTNKECELCDDKATQYLDGYLCDKHHNCRTKLSRYSPSRYAT